MASIASGCGSGPAVQPKPARILTTTPIISAYTVPLAVRVKNAGLLFSLDFHYSDTWADPGHQATPNAWANLNFTQLVQQMRTYNSNTIVTFAAAGAMPDYVQIGNEITDGMLWTNGQLSGTWSSSNPSWIRLGQLMNAAIQGIKDATNATGAKMPKIIVHIDRGGDWATTKSYFDNLNAQGVPYDIIGESYYPFYQGSPASLSNCLNNAAARYDKPIIVAEDRFSLHEHLPYLLDEQRSQSLWLPSHQSRSGQLHRNGGSNCGRCPQPTRRRHLLLGNRISGRQRCQRSRFQYGVVF